MHNNAESANKRPPNLALGYIGYAAASNLKGTTCNERARSPIDHDVAERECPKTASSPEKGKQKVAMVKKKRRAWV